MALTNYSSPHLPRIKRTMLGTDGSERSTLLLPALDSASIYLGGIVPLIQGSDGTPVGAEFGIPAWTDDDIIGGIVIGMKRKGASVPLWDDASKAGTVTNATGELPVKYTFSATNDQSNATPDFELLEILPIFNGDILEMALWGASTASVARGTTTASGSTNSSANMGVGLAVNATYHFALTESSALNALANLDFMTTLLDGQLPSNPNHVYVMPIRSFGSFKNVE